MNSTRLALVVDDDPEIRTLIGRYLQQLEFTVREAGDGRHAIAALQEARPTLLCLDLMLPESSGFDICEHVAGSTALQGLPILVMSARTMPEDKALAEELGACTYLTKPFTHADFVEMVQATLAARGVS